MSIERLYPYVTAANGDKVKALRLYERNTQLSEALYGPLQGLEIVWRNALHIQLTKKFGPQWFDELKKNNLLEFEQLEKIRFAKERLVRMGKPETPGRIVAELSFGFWTALCSKRYMATLWIGCLNKPFLGKKIGRAMIFLQLDDIRQLRNRVAHHEPILGRNLETDFRTIVDLVRLVCGASAMWIESTSCFGERFAQLPPEQSP